MGAFAEFRKLFKEYMMTSTFHGARFLVNEEYSVREKIFWFICICLAWVTSIVLIVKSLETFEHNAISVAVESSHRDWNTEFPSVIVCETKNPANVQRVAEKLWGPDHNFNMEEVLHEIAYFRGESYFTLEECGTLPGPQCILSNFSFYSGLVRSTCENTLSKCQWNDEEEINCCDFFRPLKSEIGLCFAINSIQSENPDKAKIPMIMNKFTGPGFFRMKVHTEADIYLVGQEDVPYLLTPKSEILSVKPRRNYRRLISVRDTVNDLETRSVGVKYRNCRFTDEDHHLTVHRHYSYSACSVQCRRGQQLRVCNCTNHLMPGTLPESHCDIEGLKCLSENYELLSVVIPHWHQGTRKGVVCRECLPSCTEVDISTIYDHQSEISPLDSEAPLFANVEIALHSLPTERYKRNVVRGRLDLVVSIGGSTGLLVGASLLSFVEAIYYFTVRPYVNYRTQQKRKAIEELEMEKKLKLGEENLKRIQTKVRGATSAVMVVGASGKRGKRIEGGGEVGGVDVDVGVGTFPWTE